MKSANYYKLKIIEYSYQNQLAHVSSCLNAVEPLRDIYTVKKPDDKVVLSCGHSYLAQRVILEDLGVDVPKGFRTHPDRGTGIDCSTGSLGMGFPISLGMALAHPEKTVFCVTSDGEWAEGSCFEALRLMADLPVPNVQLYIIANGFSAYDKVSVADLKKRITPFIWKMKQSVTMYHPKHPACLSGVNGHYKKISEKDYLELRRLYAS